MILGIKKQFIKFHFFKYSFGTNFLNDLPIEKDKKQKTKNKILGELYILYNSEYK